MKNQVNCIIVAKDQSGISSLKDHIAKIPRLSLHQSYTDVMIAFTEMSNRPIIDLLFLSIDMPVMAIIQLTEGLKHKIKKIVYTTSLTSRDSKVMERQSDHYLVRPIAHHQFEERVNNIISNIQKDRSVYTDDGSYFFRTGEQGNLSRVHKNEIMYIKGAANYVHIHTENTQYTIYKTMKGMEILFENQHQFFRVHKSFIVNSDHVDHIIGNCLILKKGSIPMSNTYKNKFTQFIQQKTISYK